MELEDVQKLIRKAIERIKPDQIIPFLDWLDGQISKYRAAALSSTPNRTVLTPKISNGQCFMCTCGRSFAAEVSIREMTNVETSSPPATPVFLLKTDTKHQQNLQEPFLKRPRILTLEPPTSTISTTITPTINDQLNSSTIVTDWQMTNLKNYENSPELMTVRSNRDESDIELSSDESRCLDDIDAVLSPDKMAVSNFIYSNGLWPQSLSPSVNDCLSHSTSNHEVNRQQEMVNIKQIITEPLSPVSALMHCGESGKPVATIHRRPMLVALTDSKACSPTRSTYFKCTQCHETFDSVILGQQHANNGMCTIVNVLENSDSHPSPTTPPVFDTFQENEEAFPARLDSKAACPICNKIFSSVHTMIRHKTSIHDRHVRYECNICSRFFFRKDKLTSHMVYHQDFDTYVCCFCSSGYKSRMLMRQHLKRDHALSGEDTGFNELLNRCQVKKSSNLEANTPVAYGADRRTTSLKRNISTVSAKSDIQQMPSN